MTTAHKIELITDLLKLDYDEFERMLPDLAAWFFLAKDLESIGDKVLYFIWYDDGKSGEIHSVEAITESTGNVEIIKGTAYTEPAPIDIDRMVLDAQFALDESIEDAAYYQQHAYRKNNRIRWALVAGAPISPIDLDGTHKDLGGMETVPAEALINFKKATA